LKRRLLFNQCCGAGANIIIHGLEECNDENATSEDRRSWDIDSCLQLIRDQNITIGEPDIKFCRRVGQRRERERPVVLGLYNQALRDKVLKANYSENISIGPDMTKKQREEEAEIWLELDQKNKNRTAEQVAKNLMWRLVGPKGDRRLILGPARQQGAGAAPGRGRPANLRGRPTLVRGTGCWSTTYRPRLASKRKDREVVEGEEEEMEDGTNEPPPKH
jgi:hypothetical protein